MLELVHQRTAFSTHFCLNERQVLFGGLVLSASDKEREKNTVLNTQSLSD